MCDLSETEDKIHFVFICSLYDNFRTTLFQPVTKDNCKFLELNNADKFSFLVIHFWKPLSKFVAAASKEKIEIIQIINYSCCF